MDCLFCKIINGEIPSKKIYEDDLVIVILDAFPNVDGHTLIIPKKHYEDFTNLDDNIIIHINKINKQITSLIKERLNPDRITYSINYLDSQKIKHFHFHILPNYLSKPEKNIEEIYELLTKEKYQLN